MTSDNPTCPFCQALAGTHLPDCDKHRGGTTIEEREAVAGPSMPPGRSRWRLRICNHFEESGTLVFAVAFTLPTHVGGPRFAVSFWAWEIVLDKEWR